MDDNATCHRKLTVQDCLDSKGIQRLVWPACSPDLNPIENVWDALGRQVAGRNYPPTNKNTLIRALTEEWDKLPQQLLDNVVQTVSNTVSASVFDGQFGVLVFIRFIVDRIGFFLHGSHNLVIIYHLLHPMPSRSWRANWQQVIFSDESRFNLWHRDGRIRVRRYAGERHIPECIIERHSGRTPGIMSQTIPFLQGLPEAVFQQDNARPHVAKTVKSYLDSQTVQLLPWPAYSPDMSPIEHVWDIVGRCLARDLRQTNFGCAYKQHGILFRRQIFKICLTPYRVV
ncbi:transposable element Tcb1 transposase [Trichonephila clavipes]|uniref:Transposable element Tcb1 transposase n=1 Tax=Trichonephila clavipes TaxID=2585209 RepID=A0A8X6V4A8_TRICX|nr:transposable element Tcb1 transposase [Trichonephila clavipes]